MAERPVKLRSLLTALLVALTALALLITGAPAMAEPGEDDGTPLTVREALDVALRDYTEAKTKYDASLARQAQLAESMRVTQIRLALLHAEVGSVANAAYRGTRVNLAVAVLGAGSTTEMLHQAATVQFMTSRDDKQLRELNAATKLYEEQQLQLANEVKANKDQLTLTEAKKKQAESALAKAGGGLPAFGVVPGAVTAKQAPRNPDGSWPKESCNQKDPTTSGCLTPRTLHALNETKLASYTRYVSCYRGGGGGEHPRGRACDFSAAPGGFQNRAATGADKSYGDRLAGWYMANASRLGILYVIWYQKIWHPGLGWRTYSGRGSPAAAHTNHVHLSMI